MGTPLSYNSYNLFVGDDRSSFLGNMQTIAQLAKQAGIPFTPVVQGSAFDTGWRLPNIDELRFLSNSALAFGAQGIWYFSYWTPFGPSTGGIAPFPDGTQTSVFTALRSINPQFVRVASKLQRLHWLGAYLKGYLPSAMPPAVTPLTGSAVFDIASVGNTATYVDGAPLQGVLFGYFGPNWSAPATHALVLNLDYTSSKSYRVSGPAQLSVFDARTGVWSATGQSYADISLPPGAAVLIALTSSALTSASWLPAVIDSALQNVH